MAFDIFTRCLYSVHRRNLLRTLCRDLLATQLTGSFNDNTCTQTGTMTQNLSPLPCPMPPVAETIANLQNCQTVHPGHRHAAAPLFPSSSRPLPSRQSFHLRAVESIVAISPTPPTTTGALVNMVRRADDWRNELCRPLQQPANNAVHAVHNTAYRQTAKLPSRRAFLCRAVHRRAAEPPSPSSSRPSPSRQAFHLRLIEPINAVSPPPPLPPPLLFLVL